MSIRIGTNIIASNTQYTVLPTPSADFLGKIAQYIGTTTADYTQGYFYQCVANETSPITYSWSPISVQPGGGGGSSNYNDLTNKPQINGVTLQGNKTSAQLGIKTFAPFPSDFVTSGTLQTVVASIVDSQSAIAGNAFLGGIDGACTPWGSGNAECKVEYMLDGLAVLTVSSADVPPYSWEYNTASGDYVWKSKVAQLKIMPTPDATCSDVVIQYIGSTTANYTNGYFYKCVESSGSYSWTQLNVQPQGDSLPSQTGQAGKYLTTDGTNASWSGSVYTQSNLLAGTNVSITPAALTNRTVTGFKNGYFTIPFTNPTTSMEFAIHVKMPSTLHSEGQECTVFFSGRDVEHSIDSYGMHLQKYTYSGDPLKMWAYANGSAVFSDLTVASSTGTQVNAEYWFKVSWDGSTYRFYNKTTESASYVEYTTYSSPTPIATSTGLLNIGSNGSGSNLADGIVYVKDLYLKVDGNYVFNGATDTLTVVGNPTISGDATSYQINATNQLPSQSGQSGKYLTTDGTSASWATVQGGGDTAMTAIAATSGTITLETNKVYKATLNGNTTFSLPATPDNTKFNQIYLQIDLTNNATIDFGTTHYFSVAPILNLGLNWLNYEYNALDNYWYVGSVGGASLKPVQVLVMPTASALYANQIYQYVGTTDSNYTNGYFYKCTAQGTSPETYVWVRTDVQPMPDPLPSQSGQSGKYLTTDGTSASWATVDLSSKQNVRTLVADTTSTTATIASVAGNTDYTFSQPLTALTITAVTADIMNEATLTFTASATGCTVTLPASGLTQLGAPVTLGTANCQYTISFWNNFYIVGIVEP